jgi:hypothetical protein
MFAGLHPPVRFFDGLDDVIFGNRAENIEAKPAVIGIPLDAEIPVLLAEHMNGGMFQAMVPADPADQLIKHIASNLPLSSQIYSMVPGKGKKSHEGVSNELARAVPGTGREAFN